MVFTKRNMTIRKVIVHLSYTLRIQLRGLNKNLHKKLDHGNNNTKVTLAIKIRSHNIVCVDFVLKELLVLHQTFKIHIHYVQT